MERTPAPEPKYIRYDGAACGQKNTVTAAHRRGVEFLLIACVFSEAEKCTRFRLQCVCTRVLARVWRQQASEYI